MLPGDLSLLPGTLKNFCLLPGAQIQEKFWVDLSAAGENFQDLESCFARNVSPKFDFQKCSNPFFFFRNDVSN